MSPHLLHSQGAPPYFLSINSDSYFYSKFKQIAFQLKRARKTHRAQALRLKRKKYHYLYTGPENFEHCDKYTSVALNWIQICNNPKCSSKPSLSPFLAPSSFWCPENFSPEFPEAPGEENSFTLWHLCSPGQSWPGRQGGHTARTASLEEEPALPWRDKSHLSTSRRICFIIFFLKILRFKFSSSS